MDSETLDKIAAFQKQKSYLQAIEHVKAVMPKHMLDEKWLEAALLQMTDLLVLARDETKVVAYLQTVACPIFDAIPTKAKSNKLLKLIMEKISSLATLPVQTSAVKLLVKWSTDQNRVYLRQSLETRLISLYLETKSFSDALALINTLLKELKKLDDKMALIEVSLLESKCFHYLRNLPKSRASLTSARTNANAIYCPPAIQAQLDMQSGILHAEDKDFKTAYSYFYETMEGLSSQDDPSAILALKYMLLCKVMLGLADDVFSLLTGKLALKFQGSEVDSMKAVAKAYKNRNLKEFEAALAQYVPELQNDVIVHFHLKTLYDQLLEQNLARLIEPYSRVQVSHIAELIHIPVLQVEQKLSQMILDKSLSGILDQRDGTLHVYEPSQVDKTFGYAIDTIKSMETVVASLYEKARTL